ncbi:hypothetical protein BGX26_007442 [Mortierella sp. AD094]|nr:hypothetical protein BGX26_007442 [Mortierella sp. AD094]
MSAQLPPGWVSQYDPQYQRYFYVGPSHHGQPFGPNPSGASSSPMMNGPPPGDYSSGGERGMSSMLGMGESKSYGGGSPPAYGAYNVAPAVAAVPAQQQHHHKSKLGMGAAAALLVGGVAYAGHEHHKHERERREWDRW